MTAEAVSPAGGIARRFRWSLGGCAILLVLLVLAALCFGKYELSLAQIGSLIAAKITGQPADEAMAATVFWQIRLPRVLAGLAVGFALSAAGATYQGIFRNPLVSPDILGVSAGASLGAVLGIFLSQPIFVIQLFAFAGGMAAVFVVYAIGAALRHHDPTLVLVLSGLAVGALLAAGISLIKLLADPYNQLPAITYWLLGSLAAVTARDVMAVLPALIIALVPLYLLRWRMNVMTLGEEEARALGTPTRRLRITFIAAATLMTAGCVSITGVIGWVGLLIPHIARMLVGPDFAKLLPASLLLGGGFLVLIDLLARTLSPTELPLGILTALMGAPFFLWLLATTRQGWR